MIAYDPSDEKTCTRLSGSIVANNNTWKLIGKNLITMKFRKMIRNKNNNIFFLILNSKKFRRECP